MTLASIFQNEPNELPPEFPKRTQWLDESAATPFQNEAAIGELIDGPCRDRRAGNPRPWGNRVNDCTHAEWVGFGHLPPFSVVRITVRHAGESGELPQVAGFDVG